MIHEKTRHWSGAPPAKDVSSLGCSTSSACLPPLERRLALLDEGLDRFLVIFRAREADQPLGLAMERRAGNRCAAPRRDCPSWRAARAPGPSAIDLASAKASSCKLGIVDHAVDQADPLAALGVDPLGGEHQFARPRGTDRAGEQPGDAVIARQADARIARRAERRLRRRSGCRRPARWRGPAPAAAPGSAAIVGLRTATSAPVRLDWRQRRSARRSSKLICPRGPRPPMPFTSPPEQKAVPAPVISSAPTIGIVAAFLDLRAQRRRQLVGRHGVARLGAVERDHRPRRRVTLHRSSVVPVSISMGASLSATFPIIEYTVKTAGMAAAAG